MSTTTRARDRQRRMDDAATPHIRPFHSATSQRTPPSSNSKISRPPVQSCSAITQRELEDEKKEISRQRWSELPSRFPLSGIAAAPPSRLLATSRGFCHENSRFPRPCARATWQTREEMAPCRAAHLVAAAGFWLVGWESMGVDLDSIASFV